MYEQLNGSRLIAKLQYFSDMLHQTRLEKQALAIALRDPELKKDLRDEILIYDEIINDYDKIFDDILHKGDI